MRNKKNNPLRLEGKTVILDEIAPKYFPYVIQWRNDKELNKYLNQPFELTMELETKWYEEVYLKDDTQGYMIMVDKATNTPFGTMGWTDMDLEHRRCIGGRLIVGERAFRDSVAFLEANFLICDYLYHSIDIIYCHVVIDNKKALHINKMFGYIPQVKGNEIFPNELFVNGMNQIELYRTKKLYLEKKKLLWDNLQKVLIE